jgi:hypothetical protein
MVTTVTLLLVIYLNVLDNIMVRMCLFAPLVLLSPWALLLMALTLMPLLLSQDAPPMLLTVLLTLYKVMGHAKEAMAAP